MNLFKKLLILIPFALSIGAMQAQAFNVALSSLTSVHQDSNGQLLAQHSMSLGDRYAVPSVNSVFRDNILLTLAYMSGAVTNSAQVNWDSVRRPSTYVMTLQPGEVFAFHDDVLPEFARKHIVTTNAHFGANEGFKYDGDLYGDGVCHFASLINWAGTDAGLKVVAPTRHDFAKIPDIDPKYGTAIYDAPGETAANQQQNLYIENTFDQPVRLVFTYANDTLTVSVYK
ncbi:MAG TPA: VanW family protein [Candidatus Acidoferrales bacterium]|nr:VanW family protein [Candidatus Acidoferrales bacterium]